MILARLAAAVLIVFPSAVALAETVVPIVDRPIVCPEGQGSLTFDMTIGLNSTGPGRTGGVYSDLAGETRGGLGASYGFAKGIEAGVVLPWLFLDIDRDTVQSFNVAMAGWPIFSNTSTRSHFRQVFAFGKFRLADFVAIDLTLAIPLEEIKSNQVGARVGLPFKFAVLPGRLAVHFRPELRLGFANKDRAFGNPVQITAWFDAGLTVNATKSLYFDVSLGYGRTFLPSPSKMVSTEYMGTPGYGASGWLPLSVTMGYTIIEAIDLFVGFTMTNLAPEGSIAPSDGRSLTIGLDYRF